LIEAVSSRVPEQLPFTPSLQLAQAAARGTSLNPLNNKSLQQHTGKIPNFSTSAVKDICGTQPLAKAASGQEVKGAPW